MANNQPLTPPDLETLGTFLYCLAFTIQDIDHPGSPPLTSAAFLNGLKNWADPMSQMLQSDPDKLHHLMGWVESTYHDARRYRENQTD